MESTTWYPHCKLPEYEPDTYLADITEPVIYDQSNDEIQKHWIDRLANGQLIAVDFYTGEQRTIARFYEKNILSQDFLSHLHWDGRQLQLVNYKDVREYFNSIAI